MAGKRGVRTIVVGGERYGWRGSPEHDLDGTSRVRLTAWLDPTEGVKGRPLKASFVGDAYILPGQVAKAIAFARSHGWNAGERGPEFELPPSSGLALDGLTLAGLPRLKSWAPPGAAIFEAMFPGGRGQRLARALDVPPVEKFDQGWLSPGILIRDGTWTYVFTRTFAELVLALEAGEGSARHADGLFVRSTREHRGMDREQARRVAGDSPFPDTRSVGDRVWLAGTGASARIECVTMGEDGAAWRWLTVCEALVIDRRATR